MKKVIIFTLLVSLLFGLDASSQCSMCKAVAETSTSSGSVAAGLNSGILYLMAFPYLLLLGVGYAIYRHKKAKP